MAPSLPSPILREQRVISARCSGRSGFRFQTVLREKGSCTWIGQAFPENLPWVVGTGDGTWAQVEGKNRWKFHFPSLEVSDGSRLRCEGELDLATRVFAGQMFDAS